MSPRSLATAICLTLSLTGNAYGAEVQAWQSKVDPSILRDVAKGPVEFVVVMKPQADLSAAKTMTSKSARGQWVVGRLRDVAARTQAPLVEALSVRGLPHRSFWIANFVWSRGDADDVAAVAARDDVARLDANRLIRTKLPRPEADQARGLAPPGVGWNVSLIGADEVWKLGYDGTGVVIAGQDTGYEWTHPAIQSSYRGWNGSDAVHDYNWHDAIHSGGGICGVDSPEPCDDNNHGTHTMGTMVGDDGASNRIGVSPGARWIGCRNMNQGVGTPITYSECFQWFVAPTDNNGDNPNPARGPEVINNSWSCPPGEGCSTDTLRTVVENTRAAGIVVVVSAGNGGINGCSSVSSPPAIYGASISVGATDSTDTIASFSSRGPVTVDHSLRTKPDISAPGVGVRSSIRGGIYASFSGTSMAGPHVAAAVALLLDARPDLAGQVDTIEALLRASVVPLVSIDGCGGDEGNVPNNTYGYGRLDVLQLITGDADADASSNLEDCRPTDGSLWAGPGPMDQLRIDKIKAGVQLTWVPPVDAGGTDPRYDVIRSESATFEAASCLGENLSNTQTVDRSGAKGSGFYLIRTHNDCGADLGNTPSGPRPDTSCQ